MRVEGESETGQKIVGDTLEQQRGDARSSRCRCLAINIWYLAHITRETRWYQFLEARVSNHLLADLWPISDSPTCRDVV